MTLSIRRNIELLFWFLSLIVLYFAFNVAAHHERGYFLFGLIFVYAGYVNMKMFFKMNKPESEKLDLSVRLGGTYIWPARMNSYIEKKIKD